MKNRLYGLKIIFIVLLLIVALIAPLIIDVSSMSKHSSIDQLSVLMLEDNASSEFENKDFVKVTVAEEAGVRLPVLMYHSMLNSRKGTYIVSEKQFEDDLIAIKADGYEAVFPSEVINYVKGVGTLPKKPIMITFDDGYYNNMHYALPIMKRHNVKANINVIGAFTEYSTSSGDHNNPNYSHLTWAQIKELKESGMFEIGNHTYNMHKFSPRYGIAQKKDENITAYKEALNNDIARLQNRLFECIGEKPNVFAYPFGKYSKESLNLLLDMGFEMMLTCNEGVTVLKQKDAECLYFLKRINRSGAYSTQEVINKINK